MVYYVVQKLMVNRGFYSSDFDKSMIYVTFYDRIMPVWLNQFRFYNLLLISFDILLLVLVSYCVYDI